MCIRDSLKSNIKVISNPVAKASSFAHPDIPGENGRYTLLAVSRLDNIQKRLDCLIRAFAQIVNEMKDWDLKIIGDGPAKDELQQLVAELRISNRVHFVNSKLDISSEYTHAHLFAIPSVWEGFPNALAEAMSHGIPAVGFEKAPGVSNLIKNGETGWLAKEVNNHITLSHALKEAMRNHKERLKRGSQAIVKMAKYDPDTQYDRWADLLKALLKDRTK